MGKVFVVMTSSWKCVVKCHGRIGLCRRGRLRCWKCVSLLHCASMRLHLHNIIYLPYLYEIHIRFIWYIFHRLVAIFFHKIPQSQSPLQIYKESHFNILRPLVLLFRNRNNQNSFCSKLYVYLSRVMCPFAWCCPIWYVVWSVETYS